MASFKFDKKGLAGMEKHVTEQLKKAEAEANQAASRGSTPDNKARAFARVLRKHEVTDINEAELRKKFSS